MKQAIAEQWVKALRSGYYQQGLDWLRSSGNRFCCLGVLCNLHAQAHPELAAGEFDAGSYLGETQLLPDAVVEWAGMQSKDGSLLADDCRLIEINGRILETLVDHNDLGTNFPAIAAWIENNYQML